MLRILLPFVSTLFVLRAIAYVIYKHTDTEIMIITEIQSYLDRFEANHFMGDRFLSADDLSAL